jgi:HD-GYP domain-containing protein (c-di-GMP phosphodiesterase class II)
VNKIPVSRLAVGQRYSEPVFLEGNNLLVPAQTAIRQKELDLLKSLGAAWVLSEGALVPEGGAAADSFMFKSEESGEAEKKTPAKRPLSDVFQKLNALAQHLDKIFKELAAFPAQSNREQIAVSVRQLWTITSTLLHISKENKSACLNYALEGESKDFRLAKNSVTISILSILVARALELELERVPEIAVGALLHDIGMLRLPPEIVNKQGALNAEEVEVIRSHTLHSYNIISRELAYPASVAVIALQHHERWDGTGYPYRLVGKAIDIGARIVSIADAFESMTSEKPYRNSMLGYQAMKTLVAENATHFAPNVLKVFMHIMGMYPIGSGVTLNDGRIARVVEVRPDLHLRPVVRVIANSGAQRINDGELVDLAERKQLFITQAIDISGLV